MVWSKVAYAAFFIVILNQIILLCNTFVVVLHKFSKNGIPEQACSEMPFSHYTNPTLNVCPLSA
jgi:hypothetical protein